MLVNVPEETWPDEAKMIYILQGCRWLVDFCFSYKEFVGFYFWFTVLHMLHSIYNLSINQIGIAHQACRNVRHYLFPEISGNLPQY